MQEEYCLNGRRASEIKICENGCQDGRCRVLSSSSEVKSLPGVIKQPDPERLGAGKSLFEFYGADNYVAMKVQLKNGEAVIPFLYSENIQGYTKYLGYGKGIGDKLASDIRDSYLIYNHSNGDRYSIVSSREESHYLKFNNFINDNGINKVDVQEFVNGKWDNRCVEKMAGDSCFLLNGNGLAIGIRSISPYPDKSVEVKTNAGIYAFRSIVDINGNSISLFSAFPAESYVISVSSRSNEAIQAWAADFDRDKNVRVKCIQGCVNEIGGGGGGEEINTIISVATLKNEYKIGEKIELTDPPDENVAQKINNKPSLKDKIKKLFQLKGKSTGKAVDEKNIENIDVEGRSLRPYIRLEEGSEVRGEIEILGYFVELKEKPLIETELEIKDELNELEKDSISYTQKAEKGGILKAYREYRANQIKNEYTEVNRESAGKLQDAQTRILAEHEKALDSINRIIGDGGKRGIAKASLQGRKANENEKIVREHTYIFNGFVLNISEEEAEKIAELPQVKNVYPDYEVKVNLDSSVPAMKLDSARKEFGLDGEGVVIAIIDTGIDAKHESLDDLDDNPDTNDPKIIGFKDYINFKTEPYDDHGHGTHVAGTAAGTGGKEAKYVGVAPKANLVGIKVLNQGGGGSSSSIIAGIEWAIQNKERLGIDIISMSLGGRSKDDGNNPFDKAADYAVGKGINVVVAAGNSGPGGRSDCRTKDETGESYSICSPATAKEVITVGAVDDELKIAGFSSRGPTKDGRIKPEVSAVGVDVTSSVPKGYTKASGTSMATPHISGAIALLLQKNPSLNPREIKDILMQTALDKGKVGADNEYGYGVIDGINTMLTLAPPEHEVAIIELNINNIFIVGKNEEIIAKIKNYGVNAENVNVKLFVNEKEVESRALQLQAKEMKEIKFNYIASEEGSYNIKVKIEEIQGEKLKSNNEIERQINASILLGRIKAVVVDSMGNYFGDLLIFNELENTWASYGKYALDIDYESLKKQDITYEDIKNTGADVLIISDAWANGHFGMQLQFKDSEIEAIKRYVEEGHGLIGTGGTLSELVPNNIKLAELFGIKDKIGNWNGGEALLVGEGIKLLLEDDILTRNIPSSYRLGYFYSIRGLELDETRAVKVAEGEKQKDVFVSAYKPVSGASIYFSSMPEVGINQRVNKQFFYNSIVWSNLNIGEKIADIQVYEAKSDERIGFGNSGSISAKVKNNGQKNEEINIQFVINNEVKEEKRISFNSQEEKEVSFNYNIQSGKHLLIIKALPIAGETYLINNAVAKEVIVASALFNDKNNEELVDLGNDGKYEFLNISIGVNVFEEGAYTASFALESFLGVEFGTYSQEAELKKGETNINVSIYLPEIKKFELDGPYKVKNILLFKRGVEREVFFDKRDEGFATKNYKYLEMQDEPNIIIDSLADYGIDENGNSLYDELIVNLSVNAYVPGEYSLTGTLDLIKEQLYASSSFMVDKPGVYQRNLTFDGIRIRSSKVNEEEKAKLKLRNILLSFNNKEHIIREAETKERYSYTDFETYLNVEIASINYDTFIINEDNKIIVSVRNTGSEDVGSFNVLLNENGNEIQRKEIKSIKAGEFGDIVFTYIPRTIGEINLEIRAEIEDANKEDNARRILVAAKPRGADLNINLNTYSEKYIIGKKSEIGFKIFNLETEKAKDIEVKLYKIESTYINGEHKEEFVLIDSKKLRDLEPKTFITDKFEFKPERRDNNLLLEVTASNEIFPGDNKKKFYIEAIYDAPDLSISLYLGNNLYDNFIVGSKNEIKGFVQNIGEKKAENIEVKLYKIESTYINGEYKEEKKLVSSKKIQSLESRAFIEVLFEYVPREEEAGKSLVLEIIAELEQDANKENNKMKISVLVLQQSKIVNKGYKEVKGKANIIIQYYDVKMQKWLDVDTMSIYEYFVIIPAGGIVKLDKIFNPIDVVLTASGRYRVLAEFISSDGKKYDAAWEFYVSEEIPQPPGSGGGRGGSG